MFSNDFCDYLMLLLEYFNGFSIRDFSTSEYISPTTIKPQILIIIIMKVSLKPRLVSLQAPSGSLRSSKRCSPQGESRNLSAQWEKKKWRSGIMRGMNNFRSRISIIVGALKKLSSKQQTLCWFLLSGRFQFTTD